MKTFLKTSALVLVLGFASIGLTKTALADDYVATDNPAHLLVVVNVVGGSATAGDFTITVTGASANPGSFNGSESGTDVELTALTDYEVTVSALANYTTTFSENCKRTSINEFHPLTCTITNTFNPEHIPPSTNLAHLNVIKHVVGGTAVAGDFEISVTGGSASPATFPGSETGTDVTLTPDSTYSVTEGAHDGYTVTYSEGCNGTSINEFHPITCTITNTFNHEHNPPSHEDGTATIVATKIICNSESDLPNWSNGADITSTTATEFIASHPNCRLAPDWQFQVRYWGPTDQTGNLTPNATDPGGSFVGEAGAPWATISGVTNSSGVISTTFNVDNVWHFWVREVLKSGYIPFAGPENSEYNISAEMYCGSDVQNYDNFERIDGAFTAGQTFNCVAFNVPKAPVVTDVCPNIDGIQTQVPNGKHLNNEGDCVDDGIGGGDEFTQCSDSIDNDGDGKIDFGEGKDPGCSSLSDNDETDENNGGGGGGGGSSRRNSSGSRVTVPAGEVLGAEAPTPTPEVLAAEIGLPRTGGGNSPMYALILSISGLITILGSVYIARKSILQN